MGVSSGQNAPPIKAGLLCPAWPGPLPLRCGEIREGSSDGKVERVSSVQETPLKQTLRRFPWTIFGARSVRSVGTQQGGNGARDSGPRGGGQ